MSKNILIGALLVLLGGAGAYVYVVSTRSPSQPGTDPQAGACAGHGVPESDCPWCDPTLLEKRGTCEAHHVPEALCWRCDPALVAGFKSQNDWCAGHGVPESQCDLCKAGHLPPGEREASGSPEPAGGER